MSEEIKPTSNDNSISVKETVEVLSPDGNTMNRNESTIASIFDKIETAKNEGQDVKEVLREVSQPKAEVKSQPKQQEEQIKEESPQSDLDKKLGEAQTHKDENEEISRSKFRDELGDGKKQKAEDKKEEKKENIKAEVEKKSEDDVPEDELTVLPHDKPKTAKRIQALLKKIDAINSESARTKAEVSEKANKLAELEKKLTEVKTIDPKTDETIKKQLDELSMYRRRYGLENDPEVNSKFSTRVASAETSILGKLKEHNAGDGLINLITEEGGWLKFSNSNRDITLADGSIATASELSDKILSALPLGDRKLIEASMVDQINTNREKESFFKKEQENAVEYFKKLEEDNQKQSQAHQQEVEQVAKVIEGWHKEVVQKNDWLKEKEIPATASAEEKAKIIDDNRYTKQLKSLLDKSLRTKDVNESLDMVLDSVRFYQERREKNNLVSENTRLKSELDKAKSEINKIRNSSRSIPRVGSVSSSGGSAQNTNVKAKPTSLEAAFDQIASGDMGGNSEE